MTKERVPASFKNGRYVSLKVIGQGTYGQVVLCEDRAMQVCVSQPVTPNVFAASPQVAAAGPTGTTPMSPSILMTGTENHNLNLNGYPAPMNPIIHNTNNANSSASMLYANQSGKMAYVCPPTMNAAAPHSPNGLFMPPPMSPAPRAATPLYEFKKVAVKVAQRDDAYRRSALAEVGALKMLSATHEHGVKWAANTQQQQQQQSSPVNCTCGAIHGASTGITLTEQERLCHCCSVRILDTFEEDGRICIVTELLQKNIYEILRERNYVPFSANRIKYIGYNVLTALGHLHNRGIMHCDIKPENVMLRAAAEDWAYSLRSEAQDRRVTGHAASSSTPGSTSRTPPSTSFSSSVSYSFPLAQNCMGGAKSTSERYYCGEGRGRTQSGNNSSNSPEDNEDDDAVSECGSEDSLASVESVSSRFSFDDDTHAATAVAVAAAKTTPGSPHSLQSLVHNSSSTDTGDGTDNHHHSSPLLFSPVQLLPVMLEKPKHDFSKTVLIDYGAVREMSQNAYFDIQSLWYRSPEVLCGIKYDSKIDAFSCGCLLFELFTGRPLFSGRDPADQMERMTSLLHEPPAKLGPLRRVWEYRQPSVLADPNGFAPMVVPLPRQSCGSTRKPADRAAFTRHVARKRLEGLCKTESSQAAAAAGTGAGTGAGGGSVSVSGNVSANRQRMRCVERAAHYLHALELQQQRQQRQQQQGWAQGQQQFTTTAATTFYSATEKRQARHRAAALRDEAYLIDLILRLLEYDPCERLSCADALVHPFFDSVRNPMTAFVQRRAAPATHATQYELSAMQLRREEEQQEVLREWEQMSELCDRKLLEVFQLDVANYQFQQQQLNQIQHQQQYLHMMQQQQQQQQVYTPAQLVTTPQGTIVQMTPMYAPQQQQQQQQQQPQPQQQVSQTFQPFQMPQQHPPLPPPPPPPRHPPQQQQPQQMVLAGGLPIQQQQQQRHPFIISSSSSTTAPAAAMAMGNGAININHHHHKNLSFSVSNSTTSVANFQSSSFGLTMPSLTQDGSTISELSNSINQGNFVATVFYGNGGTVNVVSW